MNDIQMKAAFALLLVLSLILSATTGSAESEQPTTQEPRLYDHYIALQQMQQTFFQRSPEDQARLQPQMHRAERQACQRLTQERQERVPHEDYRRQGGDQFVAFVEQFEQYCQTLQ
jgi:hypothetical protein